MTKASRLSADAGSPARKWSNRSRSAVSTSRVASGLVSFSLVWPWNCGSRRNTDSLAAIGVSSVVGGDLRGAAVAALLAPGAQALQQARRGSPVSWVPPSGVGTVLQ